MSVKILLTLLLLTKSLRMRRNLRSLMKRWVNNLEPHFSVEMKVILSSFILVATQRCLHASDSLCQRHYVFRLSGRLSITNNLTKHSLGLKGELFRFQTIRRYSHLPALLSIDCPLSLESSCCLLYFSCQVFSFFSLN